MPEGPPWTQLLLGQNGCHLTCALVDNNVLDNGGFSDSDGSQFSKRSLGELDFHNKFLITLDLFSWSIGLSFWVLV